MINEKLAQIMQNTRSVFNSNNASKTENYTSSNIFEESNRKSNYADNNNNSIFNLFDKKTDNKTASATLCSGVGAYGDIGGSVIDAIDGESKDGKIGNTKQGNTGDCWVLSAINSLNATQKGKELIKEALQYGKNGTFVNFKGTYPIYISDAEVTRTKGSLQYSSGDDDMIILELAVEKIMDKIANDELFYSDDMPIEATPTNKEIKETRLFQSSIGNGGFQPFVMYLLSGKKPDRTYWQPSFGDILDKFANSEKTFVDGEYLNKDFALGAGMEESKTVKDINGEKVKLDGPHAYSVKYATDDTVTVVNPHDSSKEITLSRDVFLDSFGALHYVDLSDNTKDVDYLIETAKETVENSDGTKTEYIKDSVTGDVLKEIEYYKNGKPKKETIRFQNGLTKSETYYRENGKESRSIYKDYYEDGSIEHVTYFDCDKNGEWKKITTYGYYKNGNWKYVSETELEKRKKKIDIDKNYDENGNYVSGTRIIYENGKAVKTERDTDGDGIYDTVE